MGNFLSQYNPFSVYGRYNIQKTAYENKKLIIGILIFIVLLLAMYLFIIYTEPEKYAIKDSYNIPPPRYGEGPYGYGAYIPHKNLLAQNIVY